MPTWDDGNRSTPEAIVTPIGAICENTDAGTGGDVDGDYCAGYNSGWCGNYDTPTFNSNLMCCTCGGGETAEPEPTPGPTPEPEPQPEPQPEP